MDSRWMQETPTDLWVYEPHEARRGPRMRVQAHCQLVSHYWEVPVEHRIGDLSSRGAWIDTLFPLHPGAEVVFCFTPPGGRELSLFAHVRRVVTGRRRRDRGAIGMALEFCGAERARLASVLAA